MDLSTVALRVLRAVAETGSFTAAAAELGYTQSAISRQVAALEREVDATLFTRHPDGARPTTAGTVLLRHARVVLDELDAAERDLAGTATVTVRLGAFISAGATLLPSALALLRRTAPQLVVTTREGTTPSLVRSVRAGTLDVAVVTSRPPHRPLDGELPRLPATILADTELVVAVDAARFPDRDEITAAELAELDWIDTPSAGTESLLGLWPGLPGSPRVAHSTRDWLSKLQLVRAGLGVTTVTPSLVGVLPDGVGTLRVADAPPEQRRLLAVRRPGPTDPAVALVVGALERAAG